MKKTLKLRAVVSPTPAIIAAAYDENGKADVCTLAFYTPTSHKPPCLTIAINAALADLDKAGIPHEEVRTDEYTGKRIFFFRDPDNLPIEIYEGGAWQSIA